MNSLQTVVENYTNHSFYKVTNDQDESLLFVLPAGEHLGDAMAFELAMDVDFVESPSDELEVEELNQFDAKHELENSEVPAFDLETGKFLV